MDQSAQDLHQSFLGAMRRLAATVTIITVGDGSAVRHGMTATAITSLSTEPPSLLACVNRRGALHALMQSAESFCINVLHQEQMELSRAFSSQLSSEQRFTHGDWVEHDCGLPYLLDAQANIFCLKGPVMPYNSHTIFIGEVFDVVLRGEIAPLVYKDGGYAKCVPLGKQRRDVAWALAQSVFPENTVQHGLLGMGLT